MNTIKKTILLLPILVICLTSCEKWLSVKPSDRIIEENVFNSETGLLSALNGLYDDLLKSDLYGLTLGSEFIEIMAQRYEIQTSNVNYTAISNYTYTNTYMKGRMERYWDNAYRTILNCNKLLENAKNNKSSYPQQTFSLAMGESFAIRAFLHFDLLRFFGPIYKTAKNTPSIPYVNNISVSASPILETEDVLTRIISDLDSAENILRTMDPIIDNGPQNSPSDDLENKYRFRTLRFNYYATLALKARVYLYSGDKANALKYAKLVIDDPLREVYFPFIKHTDILGTGSNPDRIFSTEVIFGMYNKARNTLFKNYFNPETVSSANLLMPKAGVIEELFLDSDNDYRYTPLWVKYDAIGFPMYLTKFQSNETATDFRHTLIPLIRLSELYLIAAESSSDENQAYQYLNKLRNQRGLVDISDNLSNRIKTEYQKEFIGEGQLYFFYKRNATTTIRSGTTNNNITMNATRYVPQLPDSELKNRN